MVLSTALFDKPAFKHLVCNGLVLAADGKKMSKRLKNYPVSRGGGGGGGGGGQFAGFGRGTRGGGGGEGHCVRAPMWVGGGCEHGHHVVASGIRTTVT